MAAVPDELVELAAELDALGGGDSRVGEAAVYCRIRPVESGLTGAQIVNSGSGASHVLVRDPHATDSMPVQQALRRYRVSPHGVIGGVEANAPGAGGASQDDVYSSLGSDLFEWWLAGFNATLIAHGQSGSGKTYTLYGPAAVVYGSPTRPEATGLIPRLLSRVYGMMDASGRKGPDLALAITCYEVRHSGAVDLLAPPEADRSVRPSQPSQMTSVSAPTLLDAFSLLATAQSRSLNWVVASSADAGRTLVAAPGRASFVIHLTLHNARRTSISHLHIVDLVGTGAFAHVGASTSGPSPGYAACSCATDFERRCLSQHLLSFTRMLAELGQLDPAASAASRRPLLAARDSRLTQVLSPLVAGNARTFLLASVMASAPHFIETCNTLRVASRAMTIRAACMRSIGLKWDDLSIKLPEEVLPLPPLEPAFGRGAPEDAASPPGAPECSIDLSARSYSREVEGAGPPAKKTRGPSSRADSSPKSSESWRHSNEATAVATGAPSEAAVHQSDSGLDRDQNAPHQHPEASPRQPQISETATMVKLRSMTEPMKMATPRSPSMQADLSEVEGMRFLPVRGQIEGDVHADLRACEEQLREAQARVRAAELRERMRLDTQVPGGGGDSSGDRREHAGGECSSALRDEVYMMLTRLDARGVDPSWPVPGTYAPCEMEGKNTGSGTEGVTPSSSTTTKQAQEWVRQELERRVQAQGRIRQNGKDQAEAPSASGQPSTYAAMHARLSGRDSAAVSGQAGMGIERSNAACSQIHTRVGVSIFPPPDRLPWQLEECADAPCATNLSSSTSVEEIGPISSMLRSLGRPSIEHHPDSDTRSHQQDRLADNARLVKPAGGDLTDVVDVKEVAAKDTQRPAAKEGSKPGVFAHGVQKSTPSCTSHIDGGVIDPPPPPGSSETVLRMLKQADSALWAERRRAEELELELNERTTAHELAIHDAQLENLEIRKQVRRLQSQSGHAEIFELYEGELASRDAELAEQRAARSELEGVVRDLRLQVEAQAAAAAGESPILERGSGIAAPLTESALDVRPAACAVVAEGRAARIRSWKRALEQTQKENARLRAQLADLQKQLRQSNFNRKAAEDSSRKLQKASRENERLAAELRDLALTQSQTLANQQRVEAEHQQLQLKQTETSRRCEELEEALALSSAAHQQLAHERQREAVLLRAPRSLGQLESRNKSRGRPPAKGSIVDNLLQVETELKAAGTRLPRVHVLLRAAMRDAEALEEARREEASRGEELIQMLVAQMATKAVEDDSSQAEASGGGRRPTTVPLDSRRAHGLKAR